MTDPVMQAAAIVTASAAAGGATAAIQGYRLLRRHDRVLFGEEAVRDWDGIVPEVQANKDALEREGIR